MKRRLYLHPQVDEDILNLVNVQCFHTCTNVEPIAYVGLRNLVETGSGTGKKAMRPVSGAFRKIGNGIQIVATVYQLHLIPYDVYKTITGPLCKMRSTEGITESLRIT